MPRSQAVIRSDDSVYSYYIKAYDFSSSFSLQLPEEEMNRAMADAECSYMAWKASQQKLLQIAVFRLNF